MVIGKKGETIRRLQQESGVWKIEIPPDDSASSDHITLIGSAEAVEKCRVAILSLVGEDSDMVTLSKEVPQYLHDSIIGSAGSMISSLRQRSGGHFELQLGRSDKKNNVLVSDLKHDQIAIRASRKVAEKAMQIIESEILNEAPYTESDQE
jgi:hypothetical protein